MAALAMVAVRPARTSNLMFNHSWQQNADSETTMESSLTFILLGSIFGTVLVPVLAALFFFSTWILRRRLVFRLNVVALILGIAQSAILIALHVHNILSQSEKNPFALALTVNICFLLSPIIVGCILLLRVASVYAIQSVGRVGLCLVLTPLVLLKVGRLINAGFAIAQSVQAKSGTLDEWAHSTTMQVECTFQLVDNTYVSCLFLWRLRRSRKLACATHSEDGGAVIRYLRTIFLIALSNFVFPCLFNVAQLVVIFAGPVRPGGAAADSWHLVCVYVTLVNAYLTVIGVVFATVWSSGSKWADENGIARQPLPRIRLTLATPTPPHNSPVQFDTRFAEFTEVELSHPFKHNSNKIRTERDFWTRSKEASLESGQQRGEGDGRNSSSAGHSGDDDDSVSLSSVIVIPSSSCPEWSLDGVGAGLGSGMPGHEPEQSVGRCR